MNRKIKPEKENQVRLFSKSNPLIQRFINFYEKHKKYFPLISFVGGFLWDSLTLTRIDRMSDNLILLAYLLLLAGMIILVNLLEHGLVKKQLIAKYSEWYPLAIQFLMGGLFSSYVVFYFQSAALTKNWLFLGVLIFFLIANEFLEKRLTNLYLQAGLFFLISFSFFIFFFPVITGIMNTFMFLLSGLAGLALTGGLFYLLFRKYRLLEISRFRRIIVMVGFIYVSINIFYFLNWIPPVPLSLKSAGIYHEIVRTDDSYQLRFESPPWYKFWKKSENPFKYSEGDTVFCFASVFAPAKLTKGIEHRWQMWDPANETWLTTDRLSYEITGGRKAGYRGYTFKQHVSPGKWRVEVITDDERILGRITFRIREVPKPVESLKVIYR